jgi:hypothetical protein
MRKGRSLASDQKMLAASLASLAVFLRFLQFQSGAAAAALKLLLI